MTQRITNGNFSSGLTGWTVSGNVSVHSGNGGPSLQFSGGNTTPNGVVEQFIQVQGGKSGTLSFQYGKLGSRYNSAARYEILDANDTSRVLASGLFSDNKGKPWSATGGKEATDKFLSVGFNLPDDITGIILRFRDVTTNTSANDMMIDNISMTIPCFCAGTLIKTPLGERAVETLRIGDLVQTLEHGYQPIRWAGSKFAIGQGRYAPILFPAGSLENTRDLWLSRQHRVLVDGDLVKSELPCDEALIAAHRFVGHARTCVAPQMHAVSYHHLLFDQHQVIFANGTAVESLYMGEQVMDMFQAEDLSSVPQRISPANETPARIIPNNHLQQKYARALIRSAQKIPRVA